MKPWTHHTVAVVAAALAIKGRANVPAATKPIEPRSTERRVNRPMSVSFPRVTAVRPRGPLWFRFPTSMDALSEASQGFLLGHLTPFRTAHCTDFDRHMAGSLSLIAGSFCLAHSRDFRCREFRRSRIIALWKFRAGRR